MTVLSDIQEIINHRDLMTYFDGKSILITGASGLIGSMLIKTFVSANEEYGLNINIFGYARDENRTKSILGKNFDSVTIIYSNDFEVDGNFDYIIHTASPTKSKYFIDYPVETLDSIYNGTKSMLELAKKTGATFVYLSSMEEYGIPYNRGEIMTEDKCGMINHLTVRSSYPVGKRASECLCAAYSSEYEVDTKIVRLAQTFGAGIPLNDNRVSMQFARSVINRENIILHTEGRSISNYCYITDVIVGILTIAIKGKCGEAYNVCNDEESRSIYDIAKLVAEEVAEGTIDIVVDVSPCEKTGYAPDNTMKLDSTKLKKLGWIPSVSMAEGYRRLVRYIKDENA